MRASNFGGNRRHKILLINDSILAARNEEEAPAAGGPTDHTGAIDDWPVARCYQIRHLICSGKTAFSQVVLAKPLRCLAQVDLCDGFLN